MKKSKWPCFSSLDFYESEALNFLALLTMGCQSGQKAKYSMKTKTYVLSLNFELCTCSLSLSELCTCSLSLSCARVLSVWVLCAQFELCTCAQTERTWAQLKLREHVHKLREHVHNSTACVDGKVSVSSGNHIIMHPLTISSNSRTGYKGMDLQYG